MDDIFCAEIDTDCLLAGKTNSLAVLISTEGIQKPKETFPVTFTVMASSIWLLSSLSFSELSDRLGRELVH